MYGEQQHVNSNGRRNQHSCFAVQFHVTGVPDILLLKILVYVGFKGRIENFVLVVERYFRHKLSTWVFRTNSWIWFKFGLYQSA
jgi:hypothetical protein